MTVTELMEFMKNVHGFVAKCVAAATLTGFVGSMLTSNSKGQYGRKLREWGVHKYETKPRPSLDASGTAGGLHQPADASSMSTSLVARSPVCPPAADTEPSAAATCDYRGPNNTREPLGAVSDRSTNATGDTLPVEHLVSNPAFAWPDINPLEPGELASSNTVLHMTPENPSPLTAS